MQDIEYDARSAARPAARPVTRRDFAGGALAGAACLAATSAGLAFADAAAGSDGAAEPAWTETYDVVVVGSGASAHAAAIEAARAGASAVVVEKLAVLGGDSALCAGIVSGWGTRQQLEQGIEVTADEIYDAFISYPERYGMLDPQVTRVNADRCGQTIDWLADQGVPFQDYVGPRFAYTELPVVHQVDGGGAKMMEVLEQVAADEGVATVTETRVTGIVLDGEGRAIGVKARRGGEEVSFGASRGVVLACGGYSGSMAALTAFNPGNQYIYPGSCSGNEGDGILMAMSIGAFVTRTDRQPLVTAIAGATTATSALLGYTEQFKGILIDADGQRFCEDSEPYETGGLGHAIVDRQIKQGGLPIWYLVGSSANLDSYLQTYGLEALDWAKGETVEELAGQIGYDPAIVVATVEKYNAACDAGFDADFNRPAENLVRLEGPFYAAAVMVSTSVTVGGVKTDVDARVLRPVGVGEASEGGSLFVPIPGLFAAGVVCEWNCANGWTVLSGMTMGRIAGQNAAAE